MALEYKPNTPQHQIEIAEILMKAIIHDEFNKSALEDALKKIKGH